MGGTLEKRIAREREHIVGDREHFSSGDAMMIRQAVCI
jgi:hypothetical protein